MNEQFIDQPPRLPRSTHHGPMSNAPTVRGPRMVVPPPAPPPSARSWAPPPPPRYARPSAPPVIQPMPFGAGSTTDPVAVALNRPWQVSLYGWMQVIALFLLIIGEIISVVFLVDSGLLDMKSGSQTYHDGATTTTVVTDVAFDPMLLVVFSGVIVALAVIELCIARAYLRGSRGAYTYHRVWMILTLVLVPVVIIGGILFVLGVGVVGTPATQY